MGEQRGLRQRVRVRQGPVVEVGLARTKVDISTPAAAGIAFDSSGDLWLGSGAPTATVVEFAKSQLTRSGSPAPRVTMYLGLTTGQPEAVAFDPAGDLWVASLIISGETGTVLEFTKAQLAKSGPRRHAGNSRGRALASGPVALAIEP